MGTKPAPSQAGVWRCDSRGWQQQQRKMRSQSCQAPRQQKLAWRESKPTGPRCQGRLLDCTPHTLDVVHFLSIGMQTLMQACAGTTAAVSEYMHECRRTIDPAGPFIQLLQSRFVRRGFESAWDVQPTPAGALQVNLPPGVHTGCTLCDINVIPTRI